MKICNQSNWGQLKVGSIITYETPTGTETSEIQRIFEWSVGYEIRTKLGLTTFSQIRSFEE